ncbi:MAG: AAA family ATPase [Fusobacteriaceae bacterium]|nr:AAA family ATPase [Fusobacteriaceae bacterium]
MRLDKDASEIFTKAYDYALKNKLEYITPELVLSTALESKKFFEFLLNLNIDPLKLKQDLTEYLKDVNISYNSIEPINSALLDAVLNNVAFQKAAAAKELLNFTDIFLGIFEEDKCHASYFLKKQGLRRISILDSIVNENVDNIDKEEYDDYYDEEDEEDIIGSYIDKFCIDLTEKASSKALDPVIGREKELNRTLEVLLRRSKSNPIHVGEAGVGKTAIAQGLAYLIAEKKVPPSLLDAKIYSVDIAALLAGTKYRGDFEDRIKKLLNEVEREKNIILYIDEIHNLMGAGANNSGAMDASNLLKPYLAEQNIKFMGSTTYDEYKNFIEKDKAFARRFQKIEITEPTVEDSIEILKGLKKKYEDHHKVLYEDEALEAACRLSEKYINDRHLPDKAIDLIDEAAAFIRLTKKSKKKIKITSKEIEQTIAKLARIPEEKIEESEVQKLLKLEESMKNVIFGQNQAIETVVSSIKRARAGLNDENKPIASLLFVGRTGVGKTELAKQLSKNMDIPMIRYDMSEYQEKHSVAKLIGTAPGYVGYEQGGLLIDAVRKNPHAVVLLDEIEKAHPDIYNILLQIMDYATLTENSGRKADFRNIILIMTSNAGAGDSTKLSVGFGGAQYGESTIENAIKNSFSPEFRNRLNKVVVFNPLNETMAKEIVKDKLNNFLKLLHNKGIEVEIKEDVLDFITKKSFSIVYGAREIERFIDKNIKDKFVDLILFGKTEKKILEISNNEILVIDKQ